MMFKVFWGYLRAAVLALIVGTAVVTASEIDKIPDSSMAPVIDADDFVFINKAVYVYKEPAAGDIVALESSLHTKSGGALFASRVVGTAGDTVMLPDGKKEVVKEGFVYLVSAEDEIAETVGNLARTDKIADEFADGEASGDDNSGSAVIGRLDSRNSALGQVYVDDIIGRVEFVVWPVEHMRRIY